MDKKIYIRVDGGSEIGLGHLVRCSALAHMVKDDFSVHFFCKTIPEGFITEFESYGFETTLITSEDDFLSALTGTEIVVLDHYGLDSEYQKKIKKIGSKLVCIDDLHDKEFFADLVINHAPGIKVEDYNAQSYTQFALGLKYALLRPEFLEAAKKKRKVKKIETVFICFGGSDPKNITKRCLNVLIETKRFKRIIAVVGVSYKDQDQINEIAAKNDMVQLYHGINASKMLDLMQTSDLAIVPSSGILLEVLSLGLKVISGMYVENQKFMFRSYHDARNIINAKNFSKENLLSAIEKVDNHETALSCKIDGQSGSRIKQLFEGLVLESEITLRDADKGDMEITFNWASDSYVRRYSFSQTEITFETHSEWFINKLKNPETFYFVALLDNKIIGSIRYDIEDEEAIIDYLIDPQFHGRGLGTIILKLGFQKLRRYCSGVERVAGYVMKENLASIRAFEKAGYYSHFTEKGSFKFVKKIDDHC